MDHFLLDDTHRFEYEALAPDGIRLVSILPVQGDLVCCKIHHRSTLERRLRYTAVSHTWGDITTDRKILCNGGLLEVTQNCQLLLRALHDDFRRYPEQLFWIDFVCIDQGNLPERGHQVARMGDTYAGAHDTVVFLGEHDIESAHLFHDLEFSENELRGRWEFRRDRAVLGEDPDFVIPDVPEHTYWANFLERPWFSRTWVVQELLLSRGATMLLSSKELGSHMVIPPTRVSVDWLLERPENFNANPVFPTVQIPQVLSMYQRWHGHAAGRRRLGEASLPEDQSSSLPHESDPAARSFQELLFGIKQIKIVRYDLAPERLLEVLQSMRNFDCSDPRDKLFGILSLSDGVLPDLLQPEYDKSLAAAYADLTWFLLTDSSHILRTVGLPNVAGGLPTWCADWRMQPKTIPRCCCAPCSERPEDRGAMHMSRNGFILSIRGVLLGRVISSQLNSDAPADPFALSICTPASNALTTITQRQHAWSMRPSRIMHSSRDAENKNTRSPHEDSPLPVWPSGLIRSSCIGRLHELLVRDLPGRESYGDWPRYRDFAEWPWQQLPNGPLKHERSVQALVEQTAQRGLYDLESGAKLLANCEVQRGDYVCKFLWDPSLFVLRRCNAAWQLIGECIVNRSVDEERLVRIASAANDKAEECLRDFHIV